MATGCGFISTTYVREAMADELFNEESTASLVNQFSCKRVQCDGSGSFDFVVINVDSLGVEQANPVVSHSKVYRGVWKGQKVAVKIVGSLNQREVHVSTHRTVCTKQHQAGQNP